MQHHKPAYNSSFVSYKNAWYVARRAVGRERVVLRAQAIPRVTLEAGGKTVFDWAQACRVRESSFN